METNQNDQLLSPRERIISSLRGLVHALESTGVFVESYRIPTEPILDMILDLGLFLSQSDELMTEALTEDVFEHPGGFLDDLANVRMIHKKNPSYRIFSPHLVQFGEWMVDSVHNLKTQMKNVQRYHQLEDQFRMESQKFYGKTQVPWTESFGTGDHLTDTLAAKFADEDFWLTGSSLTDDFASVALSSRKATKIAISRLYKEIYSLLKSRRRNLRYIKRLERKLDRKKFVISRLHRDLKKARRDRTSLISSENKSSTPHPSTMKVVERSHRTRS